MNLQKYILMVEAAMRMGDSLPSAGQFSTNRDVVRLSQRRIAIQKIYTLIYPTPPQYNPPYHFDNDVHTQIVDSPPPYRFSTIAKRHLYCKVATNTHEYELFIPFSSNNAEFQLTGLSPFIEPGKLWEWAEYAFVSRNIFTHTETKIILNITISRQQLPLSVDERFWLTRLERASLRYMNLCNIDHMNANQPNELYNLLLVRPWVLYQINVKWHNNYRITNPEAALRLRLHPWRQLIDFLLAPERNQLMVVDPQWRTFDSFYNWATTSRSSSVRLLIPKDPAKPLSPENACWITYKETGDFINDPETLWGLSIPQQYFFMAKLGIHLPLSPLKKILFTHNNETKTMAEWDKSTGLPYELLVTRAIAGLHGDQFLSNNDQPPILYKHRIITLDGVSKTADEWSIETGIALNTIVSRMRYGWPEQILLKPPRSKRKPKIK